MRTAILALALIAGTAQAEMYRCIGASGEVEFSQYQCANAAPLTVDVHRPDAATVEQSRAFWSEVAAQQEDERRARAIANELSRQRAAAATAIQAQRRERDGINRRPTVQPLIVFKPSDIGRGQNYDQRIPSATPHGNYRTGAGSISGTAPPRRSLP